MFTPVVRFFTVPVVKSRLGVVAFCAALALAFSAPSQQPDANQQPAAPPSQSVDTQQPATPAPPQSAAPQEIPPQETGGITEADLKRLLTGKALYLRSGYLDNSLCFDEHGRLIGHSPQGSYTLSIIQIDRVHVTKHKVTLEGARYGLHFLGQL